MLRPALAIALTVACGGDMAVTDGGAAAHDAGRAPRVDAAAPEADAGGSVTPSLQIDPPSANVDLGASFVFRALVTGTGDRAVDWSVTGTGTIDDGIYTAPASAGTAEVCVTLRADSSLRDCANVTIVDLPDALELLLNRWTN